MPRKGDDDPCAARTIHIHFEKDQAEATEVRRCLIDTGSDFNLISESTVLDLGLEVSRRRGPEVTGLGGAQIFPIGSLMLRWHMNHHSEITYYEPFYVISQDTPALFDVLIGKKWIKKYKALLRNDQVMHAFE